MLKGNNSLAITIAGIAGLLIWSKTESTWITVVTAIIVLALVSGDMFRAFMGVLTVLIREGARVLTARIRADAQANSERERTERERNRWEARTRLEQMKQEQRLLHTVMTANQNRIKQAHRIAAKVKPEESVEYDDLFDVEYHVVEQ